MKIGLISFTNTAPFYHRWPKDSYEVLSGTPRQLTAAARAGEIIAAPLPISSCWELEDTFEPLGSFGIAVKKESRSVFLLARRPMQSLEGASIGLTNDSHASVRLLQVLLSQKYGIKSRIKRGFSDDDDAWLVIGDQALRYWKQPAPRWAQVIDLATEWWNWQKRPFVFARWMVSKDLSPEEKTRLSLTVAQSLEAGLASLDEIGKAHGSLVGLSPADVRTYLSGFTYRFTREEEDAQRHFRLTLQALDWPVEVASL